MHHYLSWMKDFHKKVFFNAADSEWTKGVLVQIHIKSLRPLSGSCNQKMLMHLKKVAEFSHVKTILPNNKIILLTQFRNNDNLEKPVQKRITISTTNWIQGDTPSNGSIFCSTWSSNVVRTVKACLSWSALQNVDFYIKTDIYFSQAMRAETRTVK